MAKVRKPKVRPLIAVQSGQVYSYRPSKKGAHTKYLRIVSVSGGNTSRGSQPRVGYRQVSKSGKLVSPKKSEPIRSWLQWNGKQWVLPFGELVTV